MNSINGKLLTYFSYLNEAYFSTLSHGYIEENIIDRARLQHTMIPPLSLSSLMMLMRRRRGGSKKYFILFCKGSSNYGTIREEESNERMKKYYFPSSIFHRHVHTYTHTHTRVTKAKNEENFQIFLHLRLNP